MRLLLRTAGNPVPEAVQADPQSTLADLEALLIGTGKLPQGPGERRHRLVRRLLGGVCCGRAGRQWRQPDGGGSSGLALSQCAPQHAWPSTRICAGALWPRATWQQHCQAM